MKSEYIAKECAKCSAPLTRKGDELVCEYCGARYELPPYYSRSVPKKEPPFTSDSVVKETVDTNPTTFQPQIKPASKKKHNLTRFLVFVIFVIAAVLAIKTLWPSEEQSFLNQSAIESDDMYDVIYESAYFTAAKIYSDQTDLFKINVYYKNRTNTTLIGDSKENSPSVSSVKVWDNTGGVYPCEFSNYYSNPDYDIKPGELVTLTQVKCWHGIVPDTKLLNLTVTTENWGQYNFQIPVLADLDNLTINYSLKRYDNSFSISLDFDSRTTQILTFYYSDFSVVDSFGTVYRPELPDSNEPLFYSYLLQKGHYSSGVTYKFNQPFNSNSNTITVSLKINGQTFTITAPVDTWEGDIDFSMETKN